MGFPYSVNRRPTASKVRRGDTYTPEIRCSLRNLSRVTEWHCVLRKTLCTTSSVSERGDISQGHASRLTTAQTPWSILFWKFKHQNEAYPDAPMRLTAVKGLVWPKLEWYGFRKPQCGDPEHRITLCEINRITTDNINGCIKSVRLLHHSITFK